MKAAVRTGSIKMKFVMWLGLTVLAFGYPIFTPILDGFHEGEYIGLIWGIQNFIKGNSVFPLLVHGPMDYLPSLVAININSESIILFTRAINSAIASLAWIFFADTVILCIRKSAHPYINTFISILISVGMISVIPADVVEHQQAFLAIRDIFLVMGLWCTLRGLVTQRPTLRYILLAGGGAASVASLYWSYDRFLLALGFMAAVVIVLLTQRAWKLALALVVGAVAGLWLIPATAPTGSFAENAGNLLYWVRYSNEVWHLGYLNRAASLPAAFGMLVLLTIYARRWLVQSPFQSENSLAAFGAGIILVQAIFVLKFSQLPRMPNNYYFCWPFILLFILLPTPSLKLDIIDEHLRSYIAYFKEKPVTQRVKASIILACLLAISTNNAIWAAVLNVKSLLHPPTDTELLPREVVKVRSSLPKTGNGCVLPWTNEGVFPFAFHRSYCSRYTYPLYASHSHEAELLGQIKASPPAVVVFDSPFWSTKIYGRDMRSRLPEIDGYLRAHYRMVQVNGYTVGVRPAS